MTGAVPAAEPAATAAPGNATPAPSVLGAALSVGSPPAEPSDRPRPTDTTPPPTEPPKQPEPGPEVDPVEPPKEGEEPEGTEPEAKGPPDEYVFAAPEGVTLDPTAVEAFSPVAKDLGLTQEQAQRVVDVYAQLRQQEAEATVALRDQWARQVVADKELGGAKMVQQVEAANKVLKQFGTPGLNEVLQATGLCNHPEMVRLLARVGKEFSDDTHTTGSGQPVQGEDFATGFFRKMPKLEGVS
jgi:hypothetical protein